MGTNFYWRANEDGQLPAGLGPVADDDTSPRQHIGKRSAAGGTEYTGNEFVRTVLDAPLWFTDSVGESFS